MIIGTLFIFIADSCHLFCISYCYFNKQLLLSEAHCFVPCFYFPAFAFQIASATFSTASVYLCINVKFILMSVIYQSKRQYHSSNFQMPFYIHSLPLPTLLGLGEHLHVGLVLLLSSLSFPSLLVLKFIQIIQITMYFILYKCLVLLTFEYS